MNEFQLLNNTSYYSGIEVSYHPHGMLRVRVYSPQGDIIGQEVIGLVACPVCGKFEEVKR